jgi:G3E family GTPase
MQGAPKKAVTPVPVILLTGFLGSGKTTLLNDLVRQPAMANTMVIINEFGDVGLDHLLVAHSYEDTVVEMSSGCLCCTIRKDLVKTLRDVTWRFSRMGRRSFDRVIIETTGLADPAPILQTLHTDTFIRAHYRLDGVATAIDMATGDGTLTAYSEAVKQAAVADLLLLTKGDIASAEEVQHLKARLRIINPAAEQLFVNRGRMDADTLLRLGLFDAGGKASRVRPWLNIPAYEEIGPVQRSPEELLSGAIDSSTHIPAGERGHAHDSTRDSKHHDMHNPIDNQMHEHTHDPNRHDDEIRAFCFQFEQPVDQQALDDWKAFILPLLGQNMLRIKGILNISGNALPTVIQGVQHIFHTPIQLESWPDEDRSTKLVFITRGIDRSVIEGTLRVFLRAARI